MSVASHEVSPWAQFRKDATTAEGLMRWVRAVMEETDGTLKAPEMAYGPEHWTRQEGHTIVANYIACCVSSARRHESIGQQGLKSPTIKEVKPS